MTEFIIGDEEFNALYSVGAEPIDAKNGSGFMDVGRLEESEGCKFCNNKFSLLNMTPDGDVSCPKCGKDFGKNKSFEKLNKDGTGVARATRGIDPKNPKHNKMMFDYVSKAGCKICSKYDGKVYWRNDPDRPVIPRIESAGWTDRPYTHPNCKCRWVNVFNEVNINHNMQASEIAPELMNRGKKWYGDGWDELKQVEKQLVVIKMLQSSLGMENEPAPIIGFEMLKLKALEYAGQPTGTPHNWGIQKLLDNIVGNNLNETKKNEIEKTVSKDFNLENLLALTAKALADKLGKKLGVESKSNEYNDLWYASQYAKLPHWQSDRFGGIDSLKDKLSKLFNTYGFDISEQDVKSGKYGLDERMPVELMAEMLSNIGESFVIGDEVFATEKGETYIFLWNHRDLGEYGRTTLLNNSGLSSEYANKNWNELPSFVQEQLKPTMNQLFEDTAGESLIMRHSCPQCHTEFNTINEVISHMLDEDHGTDFDKIEDNQANEVFNKETGEISCDKCGQTFSPNDDWQMTNYNKHMRTHKANEDYDEFKTQMEGRKCPNCGSMNTANFLGVGFDYKSYNEQERTCNDCGVDYANGKVIESWRAQEGGKGSGKRGHSPWMLGAEVDDECPNCMIRTERIDGKCTICNN